MIGQSLPYMIDVIVGLFEEGSHVVIIHCVVDNVPLTSWFDQAAIPQNAQLVRNSRFGHPNENGEISYAHGAHRQGVEDASTRRVCQRLKRLNQKQEVR